MIPEAIAAALMLRRATVPDRFVRVASKIGLVPAPRDDLPRARAVYGHLIKAAAANIASGLVPPLVALLCLPAHLGLPLAAVTALAVSCDWLLSFCGGRVRAEPAPSGRFFAPVPESRASARRQSAVSAMCMASAAAFAVIAAWPWLAGWILP